MEALDRKACWRLASWRKSYGVVSVNCSCADRLGPLSCLLLHVEQAGGLQLGLGSSVVHFGSAKGGVEIQLPLGCGTELLQFGAAKERQWDGTYQVPCISVLPCCCHTAQVGCAAGNHGVWDAARPVRTVPALASGCAEPLGCLWCRDDN